MSRARTRWSARVVTCGVLWGASGCGVDQALRPGDHVGRYPLTQVSGQELDWYHQLEGIDCRAAFTSGELTIAADQAFRLELAYDFRCLGATSYDGSDVLVVTGNTIRGRPEALLLNGWGPDLIGGTGIDRWSLDVRPVDVYLDVRFLGLPRDLYGAFVFRMGPQEPIDEP